MSSFLETTFGPKDFKIIETALQAWRSHYALAKDDPDVSIAAEICLNLYREGNRNLQDLQNAMARHKGLNEIASHH
ncbi:hypothetical protein HGO37_23080 [Rhizobium sp. CG4]|jgi:hypothetical protein|uniref:hypothetical protein n=1 Tax=Rhizobium/Agrobacterium group TaxID=227290 RepID=UPI0017831337|nr:MULTISPECIES: hypothetical protein [Rhizobium/Agrobacterium group]MBD9390073.1 hypothetical protein [Agrobacterium sp. AGB01]MCM2458282.1 hypothetical protein [Rhizobium sp. CG4]MCS4242497.1 hypothetical protein [Rhizobium sp. BIGb0125]MDO5895763.1 hypothetical protein [Agrobacterium sp. Azo12]